MTGAVDEKDKKKAITVVFDVSKKEVHNPNTGFRKLHRKLRGPYKLLM
jgi:hypothetical protein